jgi:hypothetical protein
VKKERQWMSHEKKERHVDSVGIFRSSLSVHQEQASFVFPLSCILFLPESAACFCHFLDA